MAPSKTTEPSTGLPDGYRAIPVHAIGEEVPLRVCVLVRQTPDPVAGHFVLLRDLHDALVYLGCVTDAGGRWREWIEVWVQNVDGLEASLPAYREAFSNHTLDQRWRRNADWFKLLHPTNLLQTGWESKHPLPTFLDLSEVGPVHPGTGDPSGPWQLCQEDALLKAAGLPAYTTSLFRYLHQPSGGAGGFIPVTAGAPQGSTTRPLAEALGPVHHHLPFNPQGGLLMATTFGALGFEDYVDLLGGKPWKGLEHGKRLIQLSGVYEELGDWSRMQQNGAYLFLGAHGRAGRFPETFHLKIELLAQIVRAVRTFVREQQLPFLNLAADSIRVGLNQGSVGLPFLWTAQALLAKPSHAFALPVESSDFRYFIRARITGTSIYLPEGLSHSLQGSGSVRIRKVLPPDQDRTVLEGTLVMQERLNVSPHDLLWIRLALPTGRIDLYGHLYASEGLAQGEARFRTVPQSLPEPIVAALRGAEGVSFARSPFEIVPLLSSPCDLYALGVLAVRALLVDEQTTLAVSLDEVLSLARQVAVEHKPDVPLWERIQAVFAKDPRYVASLGPHRLIREALEPAEAAQLLPAELWYEALACILRLFPGLGPDSICRDFGDVPSLALETVFNPALEQLEKLLVRSRSLIVIDWNYNREVCSVIQEYLDRNPGS